MIDGDFSEVDLVHPCTVPEIAVSSSPASFQIILRGEDPLASPAVPMPVMAVMAAPTPVVTTTISVGVARIIIGPRHDQWNRGVIGLAIDGSRSVITGLSISHLILRIANQGTRDGTKRTADRCALQRTATLISNHRARQGSGTRSNHTAHLLIWPGVAVAIRTDAGNQ